MNKPNISEAKSVKFTKPDDYFKAIVAECKPHLPRNWREMVLKRFPDLDTAQGATLLSNIHSLKSAANVEVILYMADLAGHNQSKEGK